MFHLTGKKSASQLWSFCGRCNGVQIRHTSFRKPKAPTNTTQNTSAKYVPPKKNMKSISRQELPKMLKPPKIQLAKTKPSSNEELTRLLRTVKTIEFPVHDLNALSQQVQQVVTDLMQHTTSLDAMKHTSALIDDIFLKTSFASQNAPLYNHLVKDIILTQMLTRIQSSNSNIFPSLVISETLGRCAAMNIKKHIATDLTLKATLLDAFEGLLTATLRDMARKQTISSVPFHSVLALLRSCGLCVEDLSRRHIGYLQRLSTIAIDDPALKISTCCAVTSSFAEMKVNLGTHAVMDQMAQDWAMKAMRDIQRTEFPSVEAIEVQAKLVNDLLLSLHKMELRVKASQKPSYQLVAVPTKCSPLIQEIPLTLAKLLPFVSATTCFSLIHRLGLLRMQWSGLSETFQSTLLMAFLAHDWVTLHPIQLKDALNGLVLMNVPWFMLTNGTVRAEAFWGHAQRCMDALQNTTDPSIQEANAVFFMSFVTFLQQMGCRWKTHLPIAIQRTLMASLVHAEPSLTVDNFQDLLHLFDGMGVPLVQAANNSRIVRGAIRRLIERCGQEFDSEDGALEFFQYLANTKTSWTKVPISWQCVLFDGVSKEYARPLAKLGLRRLLHAMAMLEIQWTILTPKLQLKLWRYISLLFFGQQTWRTPTLIVSRPPSQSTWPTMAITIWALGEMGWSWQDLICPPNGLDVEVLVEAVRRITTEQPSDRSLSQLVVGLTSMKCTPHSSPEAADIWRMITHAAVSQANANNQKHLLSGNSNSNGSSTGNGHTPHDEENDAFAINDEATTLQDEDGVSSGEKDASHLHTIVLRALAQIWFDAPVAVFEAHADEYLWTSMDNLMALIHPQFETVYSMSQLIAVASIAAFLNFGLPKGLSPHHVQRRDALLLKHGHVRLPEEVFCSQTFAWRWKYGSEITKKAMLTSSITQTEVLHQLRRHLPAEAGYLIVHEFAGLGEFFPMDLAVVYTPWRTGALEQQLADRSNPSSSSSVARVPHPLNGAAIVAFIEVDGPFHYQPRCTPPSLQPAMAMPSTPTEVNADGDDGVLQAQSHDRLRRTDAFKAMLYQRQFPHTPLFLRIPVEKISPSQIAETATVIRRTVKKVRKEREKTVVE